MNDNDNEFLDELFSIPEKGFDKDDKDKLFEQYRIFLQMISSLERKREIVNRFYLSINIGLLAALGLSTQLYRRIKVRDHSSGKPRIGHLI